MLSIGTFNVKMVCLVAIGVLITSWCGPALAKTLSFSGYDWVVKSGDHLGPGPNSWDDSNAWVDENGDLHLALRKRDGRWYCSQVSMLGRLGFGRYQFWIVGRVDSLDPNVLFGLFAYPTPDVGPDGTHEIDIEFTRWGRPNAPTGNYTVWPVRRGSNTGHHAFSAELNGDDTTHRFIWGATTVEFQSLRGHRDEDDDAFAAWRYSPSDAADFISDQPLRVQMNLWLFKGEQPKNGQQLEITVRSFKFIPE